MLTPDQTGLLIVVFPALCTDIVASLAGTGVRVGEALGVPCCELDVVGRTSRSLDTHRRPRL